ncbi:MAG: dTDP-4-dehydrorhamnose reductase [Bacteroidales bacterium]|nr:dTDP-4-dehydrorhamnose reductase [Bacteroidales bacterium]
MKNILITGTKGQLGNEIKQISNNFKHSFFFTDVEELDITKEKKIGEFVKANKIDLIINCAAYTAVDKAEKDFDGAHLINVIGVKNLNKVCINNDIPLIHISTDYVFDGRNFIPYKETDQTNPQSIYGTTKLKGEEILADNKKCIIIRTSWLYSSFGNNFVKTIIKIAEENEQILVVDDQIGSPTYAHDLGKACLEIADQLFQQKKIYFGIYHYSNEGVCSWFDFAKTIVEIKKIQTKVIPVDSSAFPRPAPRPHYSVLNKSKIKTNFNIEIPYWKDSLITCMSKI